jgi:hypothetical protein
MIEKLDSKINSNFNKLADLNNESDKKILSLQESLD